MNGNTKNDTKDVTATAEICERLAWARPCTKVSQDQHFIGCTSLPGMFFPPLPARLVFSHHSDVWGKLTFPGRPSWAPVWNRHAPPTPVGTWLLIIAPIPDAVLHMHLFIVLTPALECQLQEGQDFCLPCSLLTPQCFLTQSRSSINTCWVLELFLSILWEAVGNNKYYSHCIEEKNRKLRQVTCSGMRKPRI